MSELKPCPFCGAYAIETIREVGFRAVCLNCGCLGVRKYSEQEAIEAWNRRGSH